MHQMDVIKDLPLEELRLAGNPLVLHKYKKRTDDYIRYLIRFLTLNFKDPKRIFLQEIG